SPDLPSKARKYASVAPVNTSLLAVIATPLTSGGAPHLKAMPNGARSSLVPTGDRHRILPALRSTATSMLHGDLLQRKANRDRAASRVMEKGAPGGGRKSTRGAAL